MKTTSLHAYKTDTRKAFDTGRFSLGKMQGMYQSVREEYRALSPDQRANYADFSDYLACNDALSFTELRAEFAR